MVEAQYKCWGPGLLSPLSPPKPPPPAAPPPSSSSQQAVVGRGARKGHGTAASLFVAHQRNALEGVLLKECLLKECVDAHISFGSNVSTPGPTHLLLGGQEQAVLDAKGHAAALLEGRLLRRRVGRGRLALAGGGGAVLCMRAQFARGCGSWVGRGGGESCIKRDKGCASNPRLDSKNGRSNVRAATQP